MNSSSQSILNTIVIAATSVVVITKKHKARRRKLPTCRVNGYLAERNQKGRFATDFFDMSSNPRIFHENFHMTAAQFNKLFKMLEIKLKPKRNTRPYDAIPPMLKLAIVLEYFASGDLQRHVASTYRISKQRMGPIIDQVCEALIEVLMDTVPQPSEQLFVDVANSFNAIWNFPNCVGAIDGKHVSIKAPVNAGTMFYNYKGFHSLSLIAICDASYRFTYLDIGAYGSEGDCGIFKSSKFGEAILNDRLCFPPNTTVNGIKLPYYFVADDAFPLCKRIMKPFSGKQLTDDETVYNYRLSRARRCIENAFGILCAKWACLKKTLYCSPDRVQKIMTACCLLHNFLLKNKSKTYCPKSYMDEISKDGKLIEGEWRRRVNERDDSLFHSSIPSHIGRQSDYGKYIRNQVKTYVNSDVGSLPWQRRAAFVE